MQTLASLPGSNASAQKIDRENAKERKLEMRKDPVARLSAGSHDILPDFAISLLCDFAITSITMLQTPKMSPFARAKGDYAGTLCFNRPNRQATRHSRSSRSQCGMKNAAWTGGGMGLAGPADGSPDDLVQPCSSAASVAEVHLAESAAPQASAVLRSPRSTWAGRCVKGVKSGLAWNESYIGRAAASNWVIGFRPRISSIVRNMLEVEYMVESTACRFV